MSDLELPRNLLAAARRDPDDRRRRWLRRLPAIVTDLALRWHLAIEAPYQPGGQTAWVAPARVRGIGAAVVKLAWRHPEAFHEAEALRAWEGGPAVGLHRSEALDDETMALLVERCDPGTPLAVRPESEQDLVVAAMLRRLRALAPPADHAFRPLQQMCDEWADEFEDKTASRAPLLDPGMARLGIELLRGLPGSATEEVLLCTDLHGENILAAQREPWLLVDPKPHVGDPTYDAVQHILNCPRRLGADPVALVGRMADLLDLDARRLQLWLFARCVQESPEHPSLARIARRMAPS